MGNSAYCLWIFNRNGNYSHVGKLHINGSIIIIGHKYGGICTVRPGMTVRHVTVSLTGFLGLPLATFPVLTFLFFAFLALGAVGGEVAEEYGERENAWNELDGWRGRGEGQGRWRIWEEGISGMRVGWNMGGGRQKRVKKVAGGKKEK